MIRPTWDKYFLSICEVIKTRSDCRRRQVGAVIVDPNHRIVATGYNGSLPGHPSCAEGACPRGQRTYNEVLAFSSYTEGKGNCIAIHAEMNALQQFKRCCRGKLTSWVSLCTVYVSCKPCEWCEEQLRASGIQRIVWPEEVEL